MKRLNPPVLEFRGVHFAYRHTPVLEGVSFELAAGEFACLVGPNGGGKSTLIKLALGILKPSRGTVRLLGGAPEKTRRRVGYMPQTPIHDPLFPITVREVVALGRIGVGRQARARNREAVSALLREVGLEGMADHPFANLSGGQRQRVLIARALAGEPEILFLDEPTAMVDAVAEMKLLGSLRERHRDLSVVLVSHDLGFVSRLARTVLCVNRTVALHPTIELAGEDLKALYGPDFRLVRHDHRCSEHGHTHD